jgi:hypothetical protein
MRDLYEEIQEYYLLQEALSKEPSTPIEDYEDGRTRTTRLTKYKNVSGFQPGNKYHPDYSGVRHDVSWNNNIDSDRMDHKQKKDSLHDAMHLHNHFIKHGTKPGDIVSNMPIPDTSDEHSSNKRSRIYSKMAGFGQVGDDGEQHGIVKQHPHDHEDESKRGQHYLHPLEHHEIEAHGDKPSRGSTDNTTRHLRQKYGDNTFTHTKHNNAVHKLKSTGNNHEVDENKYDGENSYSGADYDKAHKASIANHTKPGDSVSRTTFRDDKNLSSVSRGHQMGFGAPKTKFDTYTQHAKIGKDGKLIPHNT